MKGNPQEIEIAFLGSPIRYVLLLPKDGEPLRARRPGIADPLLYLAKILAPSRIERIADIGPIWGARISPPLPRNEESERKARAYAVRLMDYASGIRAVIFSSSIAWIEQQIVIPKPRKDKRSCAKDQSSPRDPRDR